MKQLLQELGSGRTVLADIPAPTAPRGGLCIASRRSLISAGTERMLVEFGRAGLLGKARQQSEKVWQVLDKVRTDGLLPTLEAVRSKLEQPMPLGYCNVGVVESVGGEVRGFEVGDRVVSNGPHAERVAVPRNLCARIPDGVSDDAAAFTVIGAIGLQGLRLAAPTLGESFVVTGLGLIGLLTVQLLRANGCRVLGIDPDPSKTALARGFGASTVELSKGEDPLLAAQAFTSGRGVDGVLITAATRSNDPVTQAARMCRKRGRIVLVGVAGLELDRADFYEKELSFQVSCSYGPGRYDSQYEQGGTDYPVGFVRWTEQRNFEAVLDMMASGALDVSPLITHRFPFDDAARAYDLLVGDEPYLGILLEYSQTSREPPVRTIQMREPLASAVQRTVRVGFVGAGNYASRVLMPAFAKAGSELLAVASAGGVTAAHAAAKHGFGTATTDVAAVLADPRVDLVVVATRHDSHARYVIEAIEAGKHVFTEKPLCLTLDELQRIEVAVAGQQRLLMVGFNRRFAPHVQRIKALLTATPGPKAFVMTVNAGAIPAAHWTQDLRIGGGRIVGEACHFVDLLRHLCGVPIVGHKAVALDTPTRDSATFILHFADGSVGTVHYFANGSSAFPKERLTVFAGGRVLELDNFRRLRGFGWPGLRSERLWRQDKGQRACAQAVITAVRDGGAAPIPFAELLEVSRCSIEIQQALR
jgi:predicted dehydrogenase/threonine dehydrogenase-like Zn-dependent dehydrogenase